jgi:hypothetical protein
MRKVSLAATLAVLASLLLPIVGATPASAAVPINVSFDNKGCKPGTYNEVTVLCANGDYKNGNLGKSWNELDLVPFRVTAKAGNQNGTPATQTYSFAVVLDNEDAGHPGYDVISSLTLNTSLSAASCDSTPTDTGQQTVNNFGGIDQSIYRLVTITQLKNTTCVYDYYGRLALGSHLFPGSALHANMANENLGTAGVGAEEISIPVNEILPQELRKTMTAQQQDANVTWDITKNATPAVLKFGDICDPASPTSLTTSIEIKWTKNPATGGDVLVTTHIFAKNPAHRVITVHVTDVIKSGSTVLGTLSTPAAGVDVPANTELEVLSQSITITAAQAVNLNDTATATYEDKLTGIPVPGQTTANATATVQPGNVTNNSATIQDIESISGNGLSFSVAAPSVGSFDGYTAGDETTGPLTWNSGTLSDSGSVMFSKTVYFDQSGDTSGSLDDTATLTTSGNVTSEASASVSIDAESLATLTINKTTTVPVDGDTDFVFNVTGGPLGEEIDTDVTVTILDGETSGSNTLDGLEDGNYNVSETDAGGFTPAADQQFTIAAGQCAAEVDIENTFAPATAAATKVTVPTGGEEGWTFNLYLDDDATPGPSAGDTLFDSDVTDATGAAVFAKALEEGDYYIVEVEQDGWISDGGVSCTFSVNYPADAGELFDDCVFTNTKKADAEVVKVTNPEGSEAGWTFTLYADDDETPGVSAGDSVVATVISQDDQPLNFGKKLDAGDYYVLETDGPPGFESDGGANCVFTVAYPGDAGKTFTCTFTNSAQGNIIIRKVTDPTGSAQSFEFDPSYGSGNFNLTDGQQNDSGSLPSGTYSVSEVNIPTGWDLTSATCDNGDAPSAIHLTTGVTITCTFTNVQRGKIIVQKVTDPTGSPQSFEFTPSYNGGTKFNLTDGQQNDSGFLVPGKYSVAETPVTGWDLTSATCDQGETVADIDVGAGETVTCTFNNRQRGTISVSKTLTNGPATTAFTFELRQGARDSDPGTGNDTPGTLLDTKVITANNVPVQLNGFLVPGVYQVCEILPGPGWTSDLGGASQFILTLNLDNSRVCADFTVGAGEAKVISVANTQPGGAQLTIGYWKNHASCKASKGGQAAVLDQTLAKADPTGTTIGLLTLHGTTADCTKAVNILNKTTIDGRTKKASDPLFNMAAQLLAARLNVTGGAGTCPASINAVNAAQALLVKYNWNGLTYSPTLTAADATLANQLNNSLDQYNNGLLC